MLLTDDIIRAEVLREFAALTGRHKPAALSDRFQCTLSGDGPMHLDVQFAGKRQAATDFPAEALTWALDRFGAQIAKPLAVQLFNSHQSGG